MVRTQSELAEHYVKMQIDTAPRRRIVYLLHEKCVYDVQKALRFADRRRELLDRAQNILSQLQRSLVVDDTVSQSLYYLYDYCYVRLETGGVNDIMDVLGILRPLRDTFHTLLFNP
jgi:flagellin-specific chaperone FliS